MKDVLKEKTLIIITHKLGVAQKMDYIFMMEKGRVVEQGSHESLLEQQSKYADLFAEEG